MGDAMGTETLDRQKAIRAAHLISVASRAEFENVARVIEIEIRDERARVLAELDKALAASVDPVYGEDLDEVRACIAKLRGEP